MCRADELLALSPPKRSFVSVSIRVRNHATDGGSGGHPLQLGQVASQGAP